MNRILLPVIGYVRDATTKGRSGCSKPPEDASQVSSSSSMATNTAAAGWVPDVDTPAAAQELSRTRSFWEALMASLRSGREGDASSRLGSEESFTEQAPVDLIQGEEGLILTPSRLRTHSWALMTWAATQGLLALFAGLLLIKLSGRADLSWWLVFTPVILGSVVQIPVHAYLIFKVADVMRVQVGPPPGPTASIGLHLQYELVLTIRSRSHMCDTMAALITCLALLVSEVILTWTLESGRLDTIALRAVMAPAWVGWVAAAVLNFMKDPQDRGLITFRDLFFIFTVMVALKVDGVCSYSWKMVFVLPWVYFATVFLLGAILLSTLMLAHAWRKPLVLILPLSLCAWLLSNIPLFAASAALVQVLDGDDTMSATDVLTPSILSIALMCGFTLLMTYGLHQKEQQREALIAQGAVWTAHEGVARRMYAEREAAQRRIDNLSEEEVSQLVNQMMVGKDKPGQLKRVGANLYKHVSDATLAAVEAVTSLDGLTSKDKKRSGSFTTGNKLQAGLVSQVSLPEYPGDMIQAVHEAAQNQHTVIDMTEGSQAVDAADLPGRPAAQVQQLLHPSAPNVPLGAASQGPQDGTVFESCMTAECERFSAGLTTAGAGTNSRTAAASSQTRPSSGTRLWAGKAPSGSRGTWQHSDSGTRRLSGAQQGHPAGIPRPPSTDGPHMRPPSASVPAVLGRQASDILKAAARTSFQLQGTRAVTTSAPNGHNNNNNSSNGTAGPAAPSPRTSLGVLANSALAGIMDGGLMGMTTPNQVAAEDADDGMCVICFDGAATCVFLDCGHGGFCTKCARLLFVRPPNECPACRQRIEQVVELEQLVPVGQVAAVKQ